MVLAQSGGSISRAIQQISNATIIDEKALNDCFNEITRALFQFDVPFKLVPYMKTGLEKRQPAQNMPIIIREKGWKPVLVCADTLRAGAFDQLKQNATKAKIPFYGSINRKLHFLKKSVKFLKQRNPNLLYLLRIAVSVKLHMDVFEVFDVKPFVSRLLGKGDWSGFMDKIQEVVPMDQQPELLQKLSEGSFTLRIMCASVWTVE
ncbi:hypothetical protein D5086_017864 [Populus alba]|uniref:Uncharacterized protein n=1 Tax=Populus alba TaxID=43335 RepID=A0ACC4BPG1_POPAL